MPKINLARAIPVGFNVTAIAAIVGILLAVLNYATGSRLAGLALQVDLAVAAGALALTGLGIAARQFQPTR